MTSEIPKLRFAVLGCGSVSQKHFMALDQIEGACLVAVCDQDAGRASETGRRVEVPYYSDYREMLEKEEIDVVSILTPSGLHAEHALDGLEYGKHLVIEKPLALRLEDAEAIIRKADARRARLFVVQQHRFNRPVVRLREDFDKGCFGKLVLGSVRVRWRRTQDYYDSASWRGTWALDGGVLANQASHHIDLLQWFMGDVESVFARTATRLVEIEAEDTAVAVLKFTNGALGVIEATTATRPEDLEGSISILGEGGTVVIGGFATDKAEVWRFADAREGEEQSVLAELNETPADYISPHYQFLIDVVDSIVRDRKALIDGLEGVKSLRLLHALYESAATGLEVKLVFRPNQSWLGRGLGGQTK